MSARLDRRPLTELVFLQRGPVGLRACIVVLLAAGVGLAGSAIAAWHVHLSAAGVDAHTLNAMQRLVRAGSTPLTVWPGWAAAILFAVSYLVVRRGPLEPSAGVRSLSRLSVADMRRGLRREYVGLRVLLVIVVLVAAIDVARLLATGIAAAEGVSPGTSLGLGTVEALGYVAAALALALMALRFGTESARLGALAAEPAPPDET